MKKLIRWVVALATALVASVASAEFHTYVIEQLFSNASGTVQFLVMHESQGMSAEYFWAGHQITNRQGSQVNEYTFPNNLPDSMHMYFGSYGCDMTAPSATAI